MFRTNNPALKEDIFKPAQTWDSFMGLSGGDDRAVAAAPKVMTLQGTINACFILLTLTGLGAVLGLMFLQANPHLLYITAFGSSFVAFLFGYLLIAFKPRLAPYLAPVFSVLLGVFATAASIMWAAYASSGKNPGSMIGQTIILQAGVLTVGIAAAMLVAYTTRLIRPSQRLLGGIAAATGGVCFFAIACIVINFFYPDVIASMWQSPVGLAVSGVIVVIATLNLIADFAIIESGVESRAPKHMEWFAAFGLILTLVWLYVSLLRLLALLSQRD